MEQLDLIKITPDGKRVQKQEAKVRPIKAQDDDFFELLSRSQSKRMDDQRCSIKISKNTMGEVAGNADTGATPFLALNPYQQTNAASTKACQLLQTQHPPLSRSATTTEQVDDAFLDMLMRCQSSRLEEQRSELPRPNVVIDAETQSRDRPTGGSGTTVPDEDFFSLIMKVQSGRMEDQRAAIPIPRRDHPTSSNNTNNKTRVTSKY
ncbi:G-protein-signaling modulator 2 [Eumeta japonica]|uniref:G-protein-signaling modulator 2 n=1 Tax=Eumeta variegata TaxID=151549 RepID=A0A4C1SN76_EUMVA|nr:G-protein-signaling modulator 2 [Eumeta japonica]